MTQDHWCQGQWRNQKRAEDNHLHVVSRTVLYFACMLLGEADEQRSPCLVGEKGYLRRCLSLTLAVSQMVAQGSVLDVTHLVS